MTSRSKTPPAPKSHRSQSLECIAEFNYYKDPGDGSPPAPTYVGKPEAYERPEQTRAMAAHGIRGEEHKFCLDTTSTGASQVFIFDHTISRPPPDQGMTDQANMLSGPVQRVHIDQSYKAGPERVTHHLPDDAGRLLKGRYQIINVWRPMKIICKDLLGVTDAVSVPNEDLLPVQLIYPDRVGGTFTVRPNDKHRWYYLKEQTSEKVTLLKCFDSKVDGRARRVPHSVFVDLRTEHESPRERIEVRSLVFHPDDTE
ncbi:hypothetical protein ACLMJK_002763 [Lecanora helva]